MLAAVADGVGNADGRRKLRKRSGGKGGKFVLGLQVCSNSGRKWGRSAGCGAGVFWPVLKLGKNGVAEGGWRWLCVDERERGQCMGLLRVQGRRS